MKTVINVWEGQAFLHQEYTYLGLPCERDIPLGSNPSLIEKYIELYNCNLDFLNDDFTIDKSMTQSDKGDSIK